MSETPIEAAMKAFDEQVAQPWARAIAQRFETFSAQFQRHHTEMRAKQCPCGCGHTLGELLGDGIINPHMFRLP